MVSVLWAALEQAAHAGKQGETLQSTCSVQSAFSQVIHSPVFTLTNQNMPSAAVSRDKPWLSGTSINHLSELKEPECIVKTFKLSYLLVSR